MTSGTFKLIDRRESYIAMAEIRRQKRHKTNYKTQHWNINSKNKKNKKCFRTTWTKYSYKRIELKTNAVTEQHCIN